MNADAAEEPYDARPMPENAVPAPRLAAATLLLMIPVTLIVPGLKELIADRHAAGDFWTHAFMSVNLIGAMAAFPLIARACDRMASRGRLAAAALVTDAVLFVAMSRAPNLPSLMICRAAEGVAHMLALSALMAAAADAAPPERRGRVMGLVGACMMLGTAAGTGLGGRVWRHWPGQLFEAAALGALIAAFFAAVMLRSMPRFGTAPRDRAGAGRVLRERPALWIVLGASFVERLCVGVIITSFVLLLSHKHGIAPEGRGTLLVSFLLPFAVCTYPAGRLLDRLGAIRPFIVGSVGFGVMMVCYAVAPVGWLFPLMIASGLLSALMFAPTLSLCAALSPADQRGAAYAAFNMAGSLGMICGPLLGGVIGHWVGPMSGAVAGYQVSLCAAGLLEIGLALAVWPWLLQLKRTGAVR